MLHDVAMYGGLRAIEVVRVAKLPGININATNKKGKPALQLVQQREEKPNGFVEAFQIMLDAIRDQKFEATPEMVQSTMKYQRRSKTSQITLTLADFVDALGKSNRHIFFKAAHRYFLA